jgi:CubicO group peptidase (beta-lactamase class C family)
MNTVRNTLQDGVSSGVFPGAVLAAAEKGRQVFLESVGFARLSPERLMTTGTVFDLASLTKPLATAVSFMVLAQMGAVALDDKLGDLVGAFRHRDKSGITVRQLLSHRSGMPAYQPYFEKLRSISPEKRIDTLREFLVAEPLAYRPGTACIYSDLGFMILQWILEDITHQGLDDFVARAVHGPLRIKDLFFRSVGTQKDNLVYAATEDCPWRGRILEGEVHDDNASVVGGVGGHAGLFGTAQAGLCLLQTLLDAWKGNPQAGLFQSEIVRAFFQRQPGPGSWALGFDTPTRPDSSSGRYFADDSVGHLGFTGTSFWMDLEKEIIVVLLTNRVHPSRANNRIKQFRPMIHDAVMAALTGW